MEKEEEFVLLDKPSCKTNNSPLPSLHSSHSLHTAQSDKTPHSLYKTTTVVNPQHSYRASLPSATTELYSKGTHNKHDNMTLKASVDDAVMSIAREGLQHPRAVIFLILWYIFSALTLFLNKYILSHQNFDPYLLCGVQMFITMLCGALQLRYPLGCYTRGPPQTKPPNFWPRMAVLGMLQLGTIFFGLVALYFVAVSFAETIKSSAPLVTVVMAWLLRGERTGARVFLSLLPVMLGLALCSSGELSFSVTGLMCAIAANVCEVVQSVVSKTVLSDTGYRYSPAELQLYPNMCGAVVQVVAWILLMKMSTLHQLLDPHVMVVVIVDGICFHCQTITAYVLMSYVSPVTYSVANTTKRAILIWLSVLIFSNPITITSGLGTILVLVGVLMYNKAKDHDQRTRLQFSIPDQLTQHYK